MNQKITQKITLNEINILEKLKQHFNNIIPKKDIITKISLFEFVIGLVFSYLGDTKKIL